MLSYITSGKYNDNLSDETARAFGRLWTGKADSGVLKENSSGQKTLMEMENKRISEDERQSILRQFSDKSVYRQDSEEPHLFVHPLRFSQQEDKTILEKEIGMAREFASHFDADLFLLPEKLGKGKVIIARKDSSPDGISNGIFIELKQPKPKKNKPRKGREAIQDRFKDSLSQADSLYMDLSFTGASISTARKYIDDYLNGQYDNIVAKYGMDISGFRVVLKDEKGNFAEYKINEKELVRDSFFGGRRQMPSPNSNNTPSTQEVNSDSAKGSEFELAEDTPSMAEVRRKYKGTDQWMKAPNGAQTNLTERQWLQVRTPEFKKWFGNWEGKANLDWLLSANPVAMISGDEFKSDMVNGVSEYFAEKYGGKVERKDLGVVLLTRRGVNSSIAHGVGRAKAAAFTAVPEVIKKGRIFGVTENYKDRGYTSYVIDAPIKIGQTPYICEVVVNQKHGETNFYLHEVEIKEKFPVGNQVRTYIDQSQTRNTNKESRLILSKLVAEGKFNSSEVVDENEEPLVVYHGTDASFNTFGLQRSTRYVMLSAFEVPGQAFFFTENPGDAENYGRNTMPVFLNIRNFLDKQGAEIALRNAFRVDSSGQEVIDYDGGLRAVETSDPNWIDRVFPEGYMDWDQMDDPKVVVSIKEQGYDGVLVNEPNDESGYSYAVFRPNQIKSATDNNGQFSAGNDSILFELSDRGTLEGEVSDEWLRRQDSVRQEDYLVERLREVLQRSGIHGGPEEISRLEGIVRERRDTLVGLRRVPRELELRRLVLYPESKVSYNRNDSADSPVTPQSFHDALADAVDHMGAKGLSVTVQTVDELQGKTMFLAPDRLSGFAITMDGDLEAVFSDPSAKGRLTDTLTTAITNGAVKLDCYDKDDLIYNYMRIGFEPIATNPYAEGYNPALDADRKRQNISRVVAMAYNGKSLKDAMVDYRRIRSEDKETVFSRFFDRIDSVEVAPSYDEMLARRNQALSDRMKDARLYQDRRNREETVASERRSLDDVAPKADTSLFELTEDEKETFTQKWRKDVERSVAMGGLVPTEVIKQFKGEDWADEELALRMAV
ncbi:MAG: hypothetical protein SPF89_04110 [Sphaerochaetaceae bacterium]|nr:hypothetical protein [Spirochaetales bacterium]MDY5499269.1 hypothetical protein [Sphaerochaetaceae bacterium]